MLIPFHQYNLFVFHEFTVFDFNNLWFSVHGQPDKKESGNGFYRFVMGRRNRFVKFEKNKLTKSVSNNTMGTLFHIFRLIDMSCWHISFVLRKPVVQMKFALKDIVTLGVVLLDIGIGIGSIHFCLSLGPFRLRVACCFCCVRCFCEFRCFRCFRCV